MGHLAALVGLVPSTVMDAVTDSAEIAVLSDLSRHATDAFRTQTIQKLLNYRHATAATAGHYPDATELSSMKRKLREAVNKYVYTVRESYRSKLLCQLDLCYSYALRNVFGFHTFRGTAEEERTRIMFLVKHSLDREESIDTPAPQQILPVIEKDAHLELDSQLAGLHKKLVASRVKLEEKHHEMRRMKKYLSSMGKRVSSKAVRQKVRNDRVRAEEGKPPNPLTNEALRGSDDLSQRASAQNATTLRNVTPESSNELPPREEPRSPKLRKSYGKYGKPISPKRPKVFDNVEWCDPHAQVQPKGKNESSTGRKRKRVEPAKEEPQQQGSRTRRRSSSTAPHMTEEQIELAARVLEEIERQGMSVDDLSLELCHSVGYYRLEKFLNGDELHPITKIQRPCCVNGLLPRPSAGDGKRSLRSRTCIGKQRKPGS